MYKSPPFNQFAQSPGESVAPHVWDKLKLVYAPCIGLPPTAAKDISPALFNGVMNPSDGAVREVSPLGPAIRFDGSANRLLQWTAGAGGNGTAVQCGGGGADFALEVYVKFEFVDNATRYSCLFRSDQPGALDTLVYGYRLDVNQKTGVMRFIVHDGAAIATVNKRETYTAATALTADKWHHVVVVFSPVQGYNEITQNCMFVIDGIQESPSITFSAGVTVDFDTAHNLARSARCGGVYDGTADLPGVGNNPLFSVALIRVWKRALISYGGGGAYPIEAVQLYADPLAMFRKKPKFRSLPARVTTIGGTALRKVKPTVAG